MFYTNIVGNLVQNMIKKTYTDLQLYSDFSDNFVCTRRTKFALLVALHSIYLLYKNIFGCF